MKWAPAKFKGKKVWVAVDADGMPAADGGRVPMRYAKKEGATIYKAGARGISIDGTAKAVELPAGVSAEDKPKRASGGKKKASGFGSAGTRTAKQAAMAAGAFRALLAELPETTVRAYTDGGCKGNPGPSGSGARVELPDGRVGEASLSLGRGTNNIAELAAVGLAMDLLEEANVAHDADIALFSDSSYTNGVLCRGWKAKKNTELILDLRERLKAWPNLTIHWVAGHVGVAGNERADALANAGISGTTASTWR